MPPLNVFLPENANRTNLVKKIYSVCTTAREGIHTKHVGSIALLFFQQLKVGDIVYGKIQSMQQGGYLIRLLCTQPPKFHMFNDVKARVTNQKRFSFAYPQYIYIYF